MKTQLKNYRHGDVCLIGIKELPKGLKSSKDKVILRGGSGGNSHSFNKGTFYPKVDGTNVIGYLKALGTTLFHADHGEKKKGNIREAKIGNGIYEIRRQLHIRAW